jgi:hypothetical protein
MTHVKSITLFAMAAISILLGGCSTPRTAEEMGNVQSPVSNKGLPTAYATPMDLESQKGAFAPSRPQSIPAPQQLVPAAALLMPAAEQIQVSSAKMPAEPEANYLDNFRACLDNAAGFHCDAKALLPDDMKRAFRSGYVQQVEAAIEAKTAASQTTLSGQLAPRSSPE